MKLILSTSDSPAHTSYSTPDGRVLYKARNTGGKVTNISTTVSARCDVPVAGESDGERDSDSSEARFGHLAQIDWKVVDPSVIRFGGEEMTMPQYLRHTGTLVRKRRTFTAPDGRDYTWVLGAYGSTLVLDGVPVVVFHRKALDAMRGKHTSYLEISPQAEHILDAVVVTFIYVEVVRRR